jgi:hypothetical protein
MLNLKDELRELEIRVASLERRYKRRGATVESAIFSVGKGVPELGEEILRQNGYDPSVREALQIALDEGYFKGLMMEDIELIGYSK